jgi:hopanoid biosynthesis associated protein HpnK
MVSLEPRRRLIVNADDFGRSSSINQAIIQAHREGILTSASLMVNARAAPEAVALAKANPALGVGLHLTLVCGTSAMKPTEIPGLVDHGFRFSRRPVVTGLRYFLDRRLTPLLQYEIHAQFQKFRLTGLPLDHVNGHLNLQLHPTVFGILRREAADLDIKHLRVTRDPFWLNARLASGNWSYRLCHAFVFALLARHAASALRRDGIRHTQYVFGLLQDGRVTEDYLLRLLPQLPAGDSEVYCHPSLHEFRAELEALLSPRVKELAQRLGIQRIRYQDL